MGRKCCVPHCASNYDSTLKNGIPATSTFQFPDDPALYDRWLEAIPRPNWVPSKRSSVCIHHFKPDDIVKYEKPAKLQPNAVPCLFGALIQQGRSAVPVKRGRPRKVKISTKNGAAKISDSAKTDQIPLQLSTVSPADHVIEDCILDFENFQTYVREKMQQSEWIVVPKSDIVHLFTIHEGDAPHLPIRIDISIKVFSDLKIQLFIRGKEQTATQLRWILGMDNKLLRWSQLCTLVDKYGDTSRYANDLLRTHDEGRKSVVEVDKDAETCLDEEHLDDEMARPEVHDDSFDKNDSMDGVAGITIELEIENEMSENFIDVGTNDSIRSEDNSLNESSLKSSAKLDETVEPLVTDHTGSLGLVRKLQHVKFKCFICNTDQGTRERYEQHMPTHLSMVPYSCTICTKEKVTIKTLASLNKHFLMHRKPLKCRFCDCRFITYTSRILHENSKHKSTPIAFHCKVCQKNFSTLRTYRCHRKVHDDPEALKCKLCERIMSSTYELKLHMHTHTGEKPNKCTFCMLSFNRRSNLTEHIRRFHSMERPFECSVCGVRFRTNFNLKKHALSHDPLPERAADKPKRVSRSTKPLQCADCDKLFVSHVSYHSHRRQHDKRYQCSYCGLRVAQLRDFEDHVNIHTGARPYECKTCAKTFRSASTYYGHLAVHGAEKKHVCTICNKGFLRLTHLQVHMRTHMGEKPFRCDTCGQRYATKSTYKRHQQTHRPTVGDMMRAKQMAAVRQERSNLTLGGHEHSAMLSASSGGEGQIVQQMEMVFPSAPLIPLEEEGMVVLPSIMAGVLDSVECPAVMSYLAEDSYIADLPPMITSEEGTLASEEFQPL